MLSFRDFPLKRKLTWIMMITSCTALVLACAAFVVNDLFSLTEATEAQLTTLAEMLGAHSTAALSFKDQTAATEMLSALKAQPYVISGYIYTPDNQIFAFYLRKGAVPQKLIRRDGHYFRENEVVFSRPIFLAGERIGMVRLVSDMEEFYVRLRRYLGIAAIVLVASFLVTLMLSARLQRRVSDPILDLVHTTNTVSEKKDYSIRATKRSQDEIGLLMDGFNDMLAQIQKRDEALQQSEQYFRSLIENASDMITIVNEQGQVVYKSPSVERTLGFKPDEMIGRNILDYVNPEDAPVLRESLSRAIREPQSRPTIEYRHRHNDGTWRTLESICTNQRDHAFVPQVVVNSRDITERKLAEEKLRATAARLESSNRELQDFAYVASHDLQEPLRKIQAFGDRLKVKCAEALSVDGRDYLARMQNAAGRMQLLINDLLSFSRVTTKARPFSAVDLTKIAHEVISDLEVRIEQTRGRVEVAELPTIDADPMQMRQLLQNLIGNALKFHKKEEPPIVQIRGEHLNGKSPKRKGEPHTAEACKIVVSDNGIGFDEKYTEKIFAVFQRLHGRDEYEGTGVGLAICRKIAERHSGNITVKSAPGQGASFIVTLPVRQIN